MTIDFDGEFKKCPIELYLTLEQGSQIYANVAL